MGPALVTISIATTVALGVCIAAACVLLHTRGRSPRAQAQTPTVILVKHRKRLWRELRGVVGDDFEASQMLQAEATRLGVRGTSLTALEAAIARAKQRQVIAGAARRA